jgi:hypothetical protein
MSQKTFPWRFSILSAQVDRFRQTGQPPRRAGFQPAPYETPKDVSLWNLTRKTLICE